ncbi:TPA: hypothetical protein ACTYW6_005671, partial [Klebsiella pneumoniae]
IPSLFFPSFPVAVCSKLSVTNKNPLDFAHVLPPPECCHYQRYQVRAVTASSARQNTPDGILPGEVSTVCDKVVNPGDGHLHNF